MPRLREVQSKVKGRKSTAAPDIHHNFNTDNNGLHDFSEFAYDEFEFDTKIKKATKERLAQMIQSSNGKRTKKKSKGYTKLFNSSTKYNRENEENDEPIKNKKQKISFEAEQSNADDSTNANRGGQMSKLWVNKVDEPHCHFSDDDLQDTDEEDIMKKRTKKCTFAAAVTTQKQCSKSITKARSTTTSKPTIESNLNILPHRGIAIDNRALLTRYSELITRIFLSRIIEFIQKALEKGLIRMNSDGGTVIASLVHKDADVGARVWNLLDSIDPTSGVMEQELLFSDVVARINGGYDSVVDNGEMRSFAFDYGDETLQLDREERSGCNLKGFKASDSWRYFGYMVEAVYHELATSPAKNTYTLSIFTADTALFADRDPGSHVEGFNLFLKRASKAARTHDTAITIVVVDTASTVEGMKSAREHGSTSSKEDSDSTMFNRFNILQCISAIRQRIQELPVTSLKIKLEVIDGSAVDFQTLLQIWTRDSLIQTYEAKPNIESLDGRLQFELPETIDGTICSISLNLQYMMLPDRIDSHSTMKLVEDMQLLSSLTPSSVEVLQTVPLQSIDSSLIYGVPMYAQPWVENDLFQYDQMKILVRQLWKYLSRNNVALVLRVRRESQEDAPLNCRSDCSEDQLFFLTSQVAVQKQSIQPSSALDIMPDHQRTGESPCNGILYRYATKNQILHFGNEESNSNSQEEENAAEVIECADYIEMSMNMLVSTGLNPFLVGESHLDVPAFAQSQDSSIH